MKALLALLVIPAVMALAAEEDLKIGNPAASLVWRNGVMEFRTAESAVPVQFTPLDLNGAKPPFKATVLTYYPGFKRGKAICLRAKNCAITFVLDEKRPAVTAAVPWNVRFRVGAPVDAMVLPDGFAEDLILEPDAKPRTLPRFLPFFIGLLDGGNAILGCVPFKRGSDVKLSADLKTWEFAPAELDEFTFVLDAKKQIWHKVTARLKANEPVASGWTAPFPAGWRAAFPVKQGFVPSGDGLHTVWNVITILNENPLRMRNCPPRVAVSDGKTMQTWIAGFDGTINYPALFDAGQQALLRLPYVQKQRLVYDLDRPVYLYAYARSEDEAAEIALPADFLSAETLEAVKNNRNSSVGVGPATCHWTSDVIEKFFTRGEARRKRYELENSMAHMQNFVESIRSRIESYRKWAREINRFAVEQATLYPELAPAARKLQADLAEIERLYKEALPRMKTPAETLSLQQALFRDIDNASLDDEALEEKAKEFGRATRTIGGTQDTLAAQCHYVAKSIRQQMAVAYLNARTDAERRFDAAVYASTRPLMQDYYDHEGK